MEALSFACAFTVTRDRAAGASALCTALLSEADGDLGSASAATVSSAFVADSVACEDGTAESADRGNSESERGPAGDST